MEAFDDVKKYAALLGIESSRDSTRKHLFNPITVSILITHGIDLILSSEYMFNVAKKFDEYVDVFFRITSLISCIIFFASIVWNLPELCGFVHSLETIIRKSELKLKWLTHCSITDISFIEGLKYSESKAIYTSTARKVQQRMDLFTLVMQKLTPILMMLPKFIISFCSYFTTDLGPDAFELPIPKWWVLHFKVFGCIFSHKKLTQIWQLQVSIWLENPDWVHDGCFAPIHNLFGYFFGHVVHCGPSSQIRVDAHFDDQRPQGRCTCH